MKTSLKNSAIVALCIFLCSCASYNLSYVKSSAAQPRADNLFVLVKDSLSAVGFGMNGRNQNDFMNTLSKSISDYLTQNRVKNTFKIVSTVYSLESNDDINLQIKNSGANAIINIRREQSSLVAGRYGPGYSGGIYSITATTVGERKPYWKAIIESTNESLSDFDDYTSLAKQVVDKLKADGII